MNINRLLHAYVTDGGHWHEEVKHPDGRISLSRCSCMKHHSIDPIWKLNPDYSTPVDFKRLTDKLFGDIQCYFAFERWLFHDKYKDDHVNEIGLVDVRLFIPWLFSDWSRFCTLFAEFLAMQETVEEFGWEECPECHGVVYQYAENEIYTACEKCNGSGKILKPWAKMVHLHIPPKNVDERE